MSLLCGSRTWLCCSQQVSTTCRARCKAAACHHRPAYAFKPAAARRPQLQWQAQRHPPLRSAEPDTEAATEASDGLEDSEAERKKSEAERLRAAEKFMVVGTGEAECMGCGYKYEPRNGDPEYPITKGTRFEDLPGDWQCPVCGAERNTFQSSSKTIAGFAENQKYGLGTNSMTEGQKSRLIFGSLAFFFALFIFGYFLQ